MKRFRYIFALVAMMMLVCNPLPALAQEATPVASVNPCDFVVVPDGFGCLVNGDGMVEIVEAPSPCDNIVVPEGMSCAVREDGSIEIIAVAASQEAMPTVETTSVPAEIAANAVPGGIILENKNNVDVNVDVVNQFGNNGGYTTLGGPCPDFQSDIQAVQHSLGAPVALAAGGECAFFVSYGEVRHMTAPLGWVISLQVDTDALIVFDGDGRQYNYKAFTARPGKSVCDVWVGQYLREVNVDDPNGVGYDTYVALPPHITTCTVVGGDAASLGRKIRASELDKFVYDPSTTVFATNEQYPASQDAMAPAMVPETTVNVTANPEMAQATPVANMAQSCPPTAQLAADTFGGLPEHYGQVGSNGWQYSNPAVPLSITVPDGMVVDHPGGRAVAGESLAGLTIFTIYWLSC